MKLNEGFEETETKLDQRLVTGDTAGHRMDKEASRARIHELEVQMPDAIAKIQRSIEDAQLIENLREQMSERQGDIDMLKQILIEEQAKGQERNKRGLTLRIRLLSL